MGVFPEPRNPATVPDVFVSLDVQVQRTGGDKAHRSYFVWEFGKPPDLVVEIVSNQRGNEVDSMRQRYAEMGRDRDYVAPILKQRGSPVPRAVSHLGVVTDAAPSRGGNIRLSRHGIGAFAHR